jgi:uncharacterized protein YcgI (DUF1989 family)
MYRIQHGATGHHPNCLESLTRALAGHGVQSHMVPTAFNIFMNATVQPDGRLVLEAPRSRAGDAIHLRAEMDLAVAVTSCPSLSCNGGSTGPLSYEVLAGP